MNDILDQLKRRTARELEKRVNAGLPSSMQLRLNPDEAEADEDEDEDDDAEDDDDEGDEGDEGDDGDESEDEGPGVQSLAFEDASQEDNLACAAAAYRILGDEETVVASHANGPAFFGYPEELDEYSKSKDMSDEGWSVYEDPSEILDLPYDHDTLKSVIKMIEDKESTYENAEDFYQKFHWGNPANVQVVKNIPGVHGTLVHLGVARRIDYGASKNGEWSEYYHNFGENSNQFPSVYAVMNEGETEPTALVIHGGQLRVEPRGIVE